MRIPVSKEEIQRGLTPLMRAVLDQNLKSVQALAKITLLPDLNATASSGYFQGFTALMIAILLGYFEIAKFLIEQGADFVGPILEGSHEGETPIFFALSRLYDRDEEGHLEPHCKANRLGILCFLVERGVAFDAPMQGGICRGSSVYQEAIKEEISLAVELFGKDANRMAESLKLFDVFLPNTFIRELSWTICSNGLHYLALDGDPNSIDILEQFLRIKNLKVERSENERTLFILKPDLYSFLREFEKNKKSWLNFFAAYKFDSEVAARLETVVNKKHFQVENGYLYITCNKRAACILEEFLRGFSASLRVGEVFEKAWEVLGENNYFQISLLVFVSLSGEQCSELIASLKSNSRKLEEFLEIARACGVSRHRNKPEGVELFFAPSSDEDKKFRQLFAEHFSDDVAIYPYAKIIKIPSGDFAKMWQVLKTSEPKIKESKTPEFKPNSKGLSGNQFAMLLFAGIDERRKAEAYRPPAEDSSNELDNGGVLTL